MREIRITVNDSEYEVLEALAFLRDHRGEEAVSMVIRKETRVFLGSIANDPAVRKLVEDKRARRRRERPPLRLVKSDEPCRNGTNAP